MASLCRTRKRWKRWRHRLESQRRGKCTWCTNSHNFRLKSAANMFLRHRMAAPHPIAPLHPAQFLHVLDHVLLKQFFLSTPSQVSVLFLVASITLILDFVLLRVATTATEPSV